MKVKFRCMKDKVEVEEEPLSIAKLPNRNGLYLVTSVHKKCGTALAKIVGLEEAEKIAQKIAYGNAKKFCKKYDADNNSQVVKYGSYGIE